MFRYLAMLPQWAPTSEQLAQIFHRRCFFDEALHLFFHIEIVRFVVLGEITSGQLCLDAINDFQRSVKSGQKILMVRTKSFKELKKNRIKQHVPSIEVFLQRFSIVHWHAART